MTLIAFCKQQIFRKMGLPKGRTNNPNGRPKGSQNKITLEVKELIQELFYSNHDQLKDDFKQLDAKDRVKFMIDLLPFIVPKIKSIEMIEEQPPREMRIIGMTQEEVDNMLELGS